MRWGGLKPRYGSGAQPPQTPFTLTTAVNPLYVIHCRHKKANVVPICDTLADCVSFYQAAPFKGFEETSDKISFLNISENDVEKWNRQGGGLPFVKFDVPKLSRIYPAWWRLLSSNYNPVPHWMAGCQVHYISDSQPFYFAPGRVLRSTAMSMSICLFISCCTYL